MYLLNPLNKSYCLHQICESNYHKLLKLVPSLLIIREKASACVTGKPSLHIEIIERTPYTLTFELKYFFNRQIEAMFEPTMKIRAYLDAKSVEVLRNRPRPQIKRAAHIEILQYKWTLNYFLEKWLNHCLQLGYRFEQEERKRAEAPVH